MRSFLYAFLFFCAALLNKAVATDAELTDAEEQEKVAEILQRVNSILLEKLNVKEVPPIIDNLAGDIQYSLEEAQDILDQLEQQSEDGLERRVITRPASKWPVMPIRYSFDGTHSDAEKEIIREGIDWWQAETCVEFEEFEHNDPKLRPDNHVRITKGPKCNARVGYAKRRLQPVSISDGCFTPGIAAHEFGHVLGLFHEHTRPDRNYYVRVNLENVALLNPGLLASFMPLKSKQDDDYGTGYDYASVMQYDSMGFSAVFWESYMKRLRTLETLDPRKMTTIGDRSRLSFNDAKRINIHYDCVAKMCANQDLPRPCENGGYQDPKNCAKCKCPHGLSGDFCEELAGTWKGAEECGGVVEIEPCSSVTITSPRFPYQYPADTDCTWHIKTKASGLIFGQTVAPRLECTDGDTCVDYFEIKSNMSALDQVGDRHCSCSKSAGRIAAVDGHEALVYFHSAGPHVKRTNDQGFHLLVFATCNNIPASKFTKECVLTETGYDYEGMRLSTSQSGKPCKPWAGQTEHSLQWLPDKSFLEAGAACRNPTLQSSPWCYVDDAYKLAEPCSLLPKCGTLPDHMEVPEKRFFRGVGFPIRPRMRPTPPPRPGK